MSQPLDPIRFPLHGTRLIEASAGTGKTYTLTALYVRLVIGHGGQNAFGRQLLPPEILVVTFTRAATQELRERIRARLAEAATCFAGRAEPDPGDGFLNTLLAEYQADEYPALADQLDAAAQWMDEAAIYTIHGFSQRMLREHAFDSGSLFDLTQTEDESALLREAVRDYWRRFCYPLDDACIQTLAETLTPGTQAAAPTPDDLFRRVRPLLDKTDQLPHSEHYELAELLTTVVADREKALTQVKDQWRTWIPELRAAFEQAWQDGALDRKKPSGENKIREWLGIVEEWASNAEDCGAPALTKTALSKLTPQSIREAAAGDVEAITNHPALAELPKLNKIEKLLPQGQTKVLGHAARWIAGRLDETKREQSLLGFQDMLTRLDDALQGTNGDNLAATIRSQYPVALVDEFQDTDPVQYRALEKIYARQPGTGWFMIGDPKQAIYGFRGADIYTYLEAKNNAEDTYSLGTNHRSAASLVHGVNELFGAREQQRGEAFLLDERIPFEPVEPAGRAEPLYLQGEPQPGMTLWHYQPEDDEPSVAKGDYTAALAKRAASHMVEILRHAANGDATLDGLNGSQPVHPGDIAVLVRDHMEADAIRNALSRRGLGSVYLSDQSSVFRTAAAEDVQRWLTACAMPESEASVRAALGTQTLGLSWAELDELGTNEQRWEAKLEQFQHYRRTWRRHGVLPMLRQLLHDFDLPAKLIAADDERRLTDILHLAELLQQASTGREGEIALSRWLEERINDPNSGGDDAILRLESDADLVQVITIHKSKGLEYPLVYLPFVCTFKPVDGKKMPIPYHNEDGTARVDLEGDPDNIATADRERLAEDLRLLYVAATRARHACWLGIAPMRSGNGSNRTDLHKTAIGHLLSGGERISPAGLTACMNELAEKATSVRIIGAPEPHEDQAPSFDGDVRTLASAREYAGPTIEPWWIGSYSALRPESPTPTLGEAPSLTDEIAAEANVPDQAAEEVTVANHGLHGFERGAAAGTFLHSILESAAHEGFANARTPPHGALPRLLSTSALRYRWQQHAETLTDWLDAVVATSLSFGDTELSLTDLDARACRPEMQFLFPTQAVHAGTLDELVSAHIEPGRPRPPLKDTQLNGMLTGFIDLVFNYQGRFFVIDYKSDWLGPDETAYDAQSLRNKMLTTRQDVQLSLYLLALHRFLRLRLGDNYDPTTQCGGGAFFYLRGIHNQQTRGICFEPPNWALIEALDTLFREGEANAA